MPGAYIKPPSCHIEAEFGDGFSYWLCNEAGEKNERIGAFSDYQELTDFCRTSGISYIDLESDYKNRLIVCQYEERYQIPEEQRVTEKYWWDEDTVTIESKVSQRLLADWADSIQKGIPDGRALYKLHMDSGREYANIREREMEPISPEQIKLYQELYPAGSRIELSAIEEPYAPLPSGLRGTVLQVDDTGRIHMEWDNGRTLSLIPNADSFRLLRQWERQKEIQRQKETESPENRIHEMNRKLEPFSLSDYGNGEYGLSLPFTFLEEPYDNYGQEAFNRFAEEHGESVKDQYGLYTHGNGYEWERVFRTAFQDKPELKNVTFDCEAGGFYCYSHSLTILEHLGMEFKSICENETEFQPLVEKALSESQEELPEMRM